MRCACNPHVGKLLPAKSSEPSPLATRFAHDISPLRHAFRAPNCSAQAFLVEYSDCQPFSMTTLLAPCRRTVAGPRDHSVRSSVRAATQTPSLRQRSTQRVQPVQAQGPDVDVQVFRFTLGIPGFDDANIPAAVGLVGAVMLAVNHALGGSPSPAQVQPQFAAHLPIPPHGPAHRRLLAIVSAMGPACMAGALKEDLATLANGWQQAQRNAGVHQVPNVHDTSCGLLCALRGRPCIPPKRASKRHGARACAASAAS